MEQTLGDRFFHSALSPLSFFLLATGVLQNRPHQKWKFYLFRIWSVVLIVICLHSNIYVGIKRIPMLNDFSSFINDADVNDLTGTLIRFTSLVCDSVIHATLVFTMWPTTALFLKALELVDTELNRPRFARVKRLSSVGVFYMLITVAQYHFII